MSRVTESRTPEYGSEDYWRFAVLFNDITYAPTQDRLLFSDRQVLTRWLWAQGWRRDVRAEDANDRRDLPYVCGASTPEGPCYAESPTPDGSCAYHAEATS